MLFQVVVVLRQCDYMWSDYRRVSRPVYANSNPKCNSLRCSFCVYSCNFTINKQQTNDEKNYATSLWCVFLYNVSYVYGYLFDIFLGGCVCVLESMHFWSLRCKRQPRRQKNNYWDNNREWLTNGALRIASWFLQPSNETKLQNRVEYLSLLVVRWEPPMIYIYLSSGLFDVQLCGAQHLIQLIVGVWYLFAARSRSTNEHAKHGERVFMLRSRKPHE